MVTLRYAGDAPCLQYKAPVLQQYMYTANRTGSTVLLWYRYGYELYCISLCPYMYLARYYCVPVPRITQIHSTRDPSVALVPVQYR